MYDTQWLTHTHTHPHTHTCMQPAPLSETVDHTVEEDVIAAPQSFQPDTSPSPSPSPSLSPAESSESEEEEEEEEETAARGEV